jgi:hypothetical protein
VVRGGDEPGAAGAVYKRKSRPVGGDTTVTGVLCTSPLGDVSHDVCVCGPRFVGGCHLLVTIQVARKLFCGLWVISPEIVISILQHGNRELIDPTNAWGSLGQRLALRVGCGVVLVGWALTLIHY